MAKKPSGYGVGNVRYGRFSGVNPSRAANQNKTVKARVNELKNLTAESDKMLKEASRNYKLISGKAAYGPKPSMAGKIATAAKGVAKGVAKGIARGAMRAAGPVGALASMTTPAGAGSDKPRGPLMSGNKSRGPGGGSLSAPARTQPSRSGGASNSKGPAGPSGPNSSPSRSTGTSKGPAGPLGPNSSPSRSTGTSKGPGGPLGPNSSPSRSGARTSFGGPR